MTRRPNQIDWSALSHAYGSAEDIPEAIEALADPERVESAVDSFYDALLHQQSIYSATGPAVVAAARMIVEGRCADPEDAGEMLLYFAQLTDHTFRVFSDKLQRRPFQASLYPALQDRKLKILQALPALFLPQCCHLKPPRLHNSHFPKELTRPL